MPATRPGNAIVTNKRAVLFDSQGVTLHLADIRADSGNELRFTENELRGLFHPPEWRREVT